MGHSVPEYDLHNESIGFILVWEIINFLVPRYDLTNEDYRLNALPLSSIDLSII